jgi:hypothetical protein
VSVDAGSSLASFGLILADGVRSGAGAAGIVDGVATIGSSMTER